MSILSRLKSIISVALHGERETVYAQIACLGPNNSLKDKKIIVTGGGRGLGFHMAKCFKENGADVLIVGRNEETLSQSAREIGCNYLKLDITDYSTFDEFVQNADNILQGVNVLVNNAGISLHEPTFFDVTPEGFNRQMSTNFTGPFFLTQSFAKKMRDDGRKASILFISSETGDTVDCRPYGFSKGAVNSMVRGLAYLFKKSRIRVNAISPGVTASDMTGLSDSGNLSAGDYGTGRYYLPDEIAQMATWIISDVTDCMSGQIITCNNGQTINARWK